MVTRRAMPMIVMLLAPLALGCADAHPSRPAWGEHLRAVDGALARNEVGAAVQAWHEGYGAALRSGTWISLVELGDAYLRIPAVGEFPSSAKPMARQVYLRALVRAQAQGSAQGALLVALAFDGLGDTEVATHCMKIAERLARRRADSGAMEQVTLERERWAQRLASRQDARR